MAENLEQITEWDYPAGMLQTVAGPMRKDVWMEYEADRLRANGRVAVVQEHPSPTDHRIAIFADRVCDEE